jgi:hypothetical protein
VFAVIESVLGYRAFLRRGLVDVSEEWTLVGLAWNLERMCALSLAGRHRRPSGWGDGEE